LECSRNLEQFFIGLLCALSPSSFVQWFPSLLDKPSDSDTRIGGDANLLDDSLSQFLAGFGLAHVGWADLEGSL
jgi:hypothetical protein